MGLHQLAGLLAALVLLCYSEVAWAQGQSSGGTTPLCPSFGKVSQVASAQVITGTAGQKLYICGIVLGNSGTAQSVNVVEGTGVVCATGIAGLLGGTTAATGINLAINTPFVAVASRPWLKTATAGDNVCVLQSGTNQLSGVITYRSAP